MSMQINCYAWMIEYKWAILKAPPKLPVQKPWAGGQPLSLVIHLQFSMENCTVTFHYGSTNVDKLKSQLNNYGQHACVWNKAGDSCQACGSLLHVSRMSRRRGDARRMKILQKNRKNNPHLFQQSFWLGFRNMWV